MSNVEKVHKAADRERCQAFFDSTLQLVRDRRVPDQPIMSDELLLRAVKMQYVQNLRQNYNRDDFFMSYKEAAEQMEPRDAKEDWNRFSGVIPDGTKDGQVGCGAVYFSRCSGSLSAELTHYHRDDNAMPKDRDRRFLPEVYKRDVSRLFLSRQSALLAFRPRGMLRLADISDKFFDRLSRELTRPATTRPRGTKPVPMSPTDVQKAILASNDYSAARGVGLAISYDRTFNGLIVQTARQEVERLDVGENVVLFGRLREALTCLQPAFAIVFKQNGDKMLLRHVPVETKVHRADVEAAERAERERARHKHDRT